MAILKQAFHAVDTFRPLEDAEVAALLAKTASVGATGRFEPFKTTSIFDATAQNPSWLGEEPPHVRALMPAQWAVGGLPAPPPSRDHGGAPQ